MHSCSRESLCVTGVGSDPATQDFNDFKGLTKDG